MLVRPYRQGDRAAVVPLLYCSSGGQYDRYAGSRRAAERTLRRALSRQGTTASADVISVVTDGDVAAAMAAMPWTEWAPRARAFLGSTLVSTAPWRWPAAARVYRAGAREAPWSPQDAFYIDSLATAPAHRRRGAATMLIAEAERQAHARGLACIALDTWAANTPARALYRRLGFTEISETPPCAGLPGGVSLLKRLG